jgi:hypothetical protein
LLTASSAFFAGAFKEDGFEESSQGEIHLIDETPNAFERFLYWLYTGKIRKATSAKEAIDLTNLYVMADKLCLESLQNHVMDALREWYKFEYVMGPTIAYAYEHTMPGSAFRKYCTEQWAWDLACTKMMGMDDAALSALPVEKFLAKRDFELQVKQNGDFAYDMCLALLNVASEDEDPSERLHCCYHEHRSGTQCPSSIDED